jgi:hypothetical protein
MDRLRTELRDWFWDGTFTDTLGAAVTAVDGTRYHPYAVYRHAHTGRAAVAVARQSRAGGSCQ